jgi:hypothetical protein
MGYFISIYESRGEKISFGLGKGVSRNGEKRDEKDQNKLNEFVPFLDLTKKVLGNHDFLFVQNFRFVLGG